MPEPTQTPCRGKIIEFEDESGTIVTDSGTKVRFGRTSCSGFNPSVGLDVWVMALRTYPVIGERATLVNLTGHAESADPEQRARERSEAMERAIREKHASLQSSKASLRARAFKAPLPESWLPGVVSLGRMVSLPEALTAFASKPIEETLADPVAGTGLDVDLATGDHTAQADQDAEGQLPRIRLGSCLPWPMYDPCLVRFAQAEGDEPDLFALYYHPELHAQGKLPVVYWRHGDELGFVSSDAGSFLSAIAHGRYCHNGEPVRARTDLAAMVGSYPSDAVLEISEVPEEYKSTFFSDKGVQGLVSELAEASLDQDYARVVELSEQLESRYVDRKWQYHVNAVRHQRRQFFDE